MSAPDLHIASLNADHHDWSAFFCGDEDLDRYLHERAQEDIGRFACSVYAATVTGTREVIAYYTVTASSVSRASLPKSDAKQMPRYAQTNAALIGRLAVDRRFKGRKVGTLLLVDAFDRCRTTDFMKPAVVLVDAYATAVSFYVKFGFRPILDAEAGDPRQTLYLPLRRAEAALSRAIQGEHNAV